ITRDGSTQIDRFLWRLNAFSQQRGCPEYEAWYYRAHGHHRRVTLLSTGLAIVVRKGLKVVLENTDEPTDITHRRIRTLAALKQKRICAHARIQDESGGELDLFNTHLSLPSFLARANGATGKRFGEADNQLHEVRAVLDYVASKSNGSGTMLVGDFNSRPGSRVYQHVLERGNFRDAYASHHALSAEQVANIPSAGFMQMRFRLDHLFANNNIHIERFELANPFGPTHPFHGLSDHAPISAVLELARPVNQSGAVKEHQSTPPQTGGSLHAVVDHQYPDGLPPDIHHHRR
ncbi:MAG: hypothetical protein HUU55_08875, partial [Myxococcales bacterium]|nr:hypothetical protein [Myxococcales bacterium]